MIYDTDLNIVNRCKSSWTYRGFCLHHDEKVVFRTNSKHQYYKLKNGEHTSFKFIERIR